MTLPAPAPLERRVLEAVDVDGLLACVDELVAIPSTAGDESPAQEAVAARMERLGLEVDAWSLDLDALRRHPAYTADVERDGGLGVVGTLGAGAARTLILNAHVDVVSAGEPARWTHPPWRATVAGGRLVG
ncbi:MAG: acetylornithine deacetylase, partial [Gemmatimonadota bacterium]